MTRLQAYVAVAVLAALLLAVSGCGGAGHRNDRGAPTSTAGTSSTGTLTLSAPRAVHRATRLPDGSVILTGGCSESGCGGFEDARTSDLFDPSSGTFAPGPRMRTPRASGTATLLRDGRVLLVGGYPEEGAAPTARAEVYDPGSQAFEQVGPLTRGRADHSATLLRDGSVLVAGGFDSEGAALGSTEIFDPGRRRFRPGPALSSPRAAHVAVALGERVVLVGGTRDGAGLVDTDVLAGGRWSPGPDLIEARVKMGAAGLDDSRLLVVGGAADVEGSSRLASTEVVDVADGQVRTGPRLATAEYKLDGAVVGLPDGRVAIAGGAAVEVYDPRTNTLTEVREPRLAPLSFRTATPLEPGRLLVVGGYDRAIVPSRDAVVVRIPPRGQLALVSPASGRREGSPRRSPAS